MKEEDEVECYDNYPLSIVLVCNLLNILIYAIGFSILLYFGWIYSVIYLLYCGFLEVRVLRKSCVNCYYCGKYCAFGKGKLVGLLFKQGRKEFSDCKISWKDLIPDFLVSLIPIIAGIVILIIDFSWLILAFVILLIILASFGNGFVRGKLACKFCMQRALGCPAQKLFSKKMEKRGR